MYIDFEFFVFGEFIDDQTKYLNKIFNLFSSSIKCYLTFKSCIGLLPQRVIFSNQMIKEALPVRTGLGKHPQVPPLQEDIGDVVIRQKYTRITENPAFLALDVHLDDDGGRRYSAQQMRQGDRVCRRT